MRYLLDSDTLSDLLAVTALNHPAVTRRLSSLPQSDSVVFSILAAGRGTRLTVRQLKKRVGLEAEE